MHLIDLPTQIHPLDYRDATDPTWVFRVGEVTLQMTLREDSRCSLLKRHSDLKYVLPKGDWTGNLESVTLKQRESLESFIDFTAHRRISPNEDPWSWLRLTLDQAFGRSALDFYRLVSGWLALIGLERPDLWHDRSGATVADLSIAVTNRSPGWSLRVFEPDTSARRDYALRVSHQLGQRLKALRRGHNGVVVATRVRLDISAHARLARLSEAKARVRELSETWGEPRLLA